MDTLAKAHTGNGEWSAGTTGDYPMSSYLMGNSRSLLNTEDEYTSIHIGSTHPVFIVLLQIRCLTLPLILFNTEGFMTVRAGNTRGVILRGDCTFVRQFG